MIVIIFIIYIIIYIYYNIYLLLYKNLFLLKYFHTFEEQFSRIYILLKVIFRYNKKLVLKMQTNSKHFTANNCSKSLADVIANNHIQVKNNIILLISYLTIQITIFH